MMSEKDNKNLCEQLACCKGQSEVQDAVIDEAITAITSRNALLAALERIYEKVIHFEGHAFVLDVDGVIEINNIAEQAIEAAKCQA